MSSEDKGWLVTVNSKIMKARWRWTRNAPSLRASLRREPSPWHRAGARAIQRCTWQFCWRRYCTSLSSCTKAEFCWTCLRVPWHDQSQIRRICGSQTNIRIRTKHGITSVENMQTWPLNGHRQSWGLAPAAPRAITDHRCNAQHRPEFDQDQSHPKKLLVSQILEHPIWWFDFKRLEQVHTSASSIKVSFDSLSTSFNRDQFAVRQAAHTWSKLRHLGGAWSFSLVRLQSGMKQCWKLKRWKPDFSWLILFISWHTPGPVELWMQQDPESCVNSFASDALDWALFQVQSFR